jgi:hypothetical protein
VDACLPAGRQVFPEDLEEAAEMLTEKGDKN